MTDQYAELRHRLQEPRDFYPDADPRTLPAYDKHVFSMTAAGLHDKADIAVQLALRDQDLTALLAERDALAKDAARYRWRTINSAPKDGTRLLLAKIIGHPEHPTAIWWVCSGAWSERWGNWNDGVEPSGLAGPTHWRPMPTPDEIEQPDAGEREGEG